VCHSEIWRNERGEEKVVHYSPLFDPRRPPLISLLRHNPFSTSAVVVRRDRLVAAGDGPFDVTLPSAEDYELWMRLVAQPGFTIRFIDEPLGVYLVRRSGNESSRVDRRHAAMVEIGRRARAGSLGGGRAPTLEYLRYVGKTRVSSGLRYAAAGHRLRGLAMLATGLLLWPFRFDWLLLWLRGRRT
jgi:hypothetical protein